MANKCPNCGYEYNDNDAFCAMCGVSLKKEETQDSVKSEIIEEKIFDFDKIKIFLTDKMAENKEKPNNFNFNIEDKNVFNFVLVMIFISALLTMSLFAIIKRQDYEKSKMRFNKIISNPALIPELREPSNFLDLKNDLKTNEYFLLLYLKFSSDPEEKKEQVFVSYLKEMDKLSHITNENTIKEDLDICSVVKTSSMAKKCAKRFSDEFKGVGVSAYSDLNTIYLYPNYKFIYKTYSKYVSYQMAKYLKLKAQYSMPVTIGLSVNLKPKKIADKIYKFEKLYSNVSDTYIKEEILNTIYRDFRIFIFSPSIYATTTQEMTPEFKNAYKYFINTKKDSQLRPVVMSYMDKMRSYSEENFKNDYPYEISSASFRENAEKSLLGDIFVQLRTNLFTSVSKLTFAYKYNLTNASWYSYKPVDTLSQSEFVISEPDENNNINVYNNSLSVVQEINLPKYCSLFLSNNALYAFNSDRLAFAKVIFNGDKFSFQQLNLSDLTTVFPGIRIINIDSYQNYNIYIEKDNQTVTYIILSRYSQGFNNYRVSPLSHDITTYSLPNMFKVSGNEDFVLSFHNSNVKANETSDTTPTYKITIHTSGYEKDNGVVKYDESTAEDEIENEKYNPNIMPKIMQNKPVQEEEKTEIEDLPLAPLQKIDPPVDE